MEPREFHWPFSFFYSTVARCMEPGYRDLACRMDIPAAAESLLDVGGGDGRLAIAIARMHRGLRDVVSGDIARDMTRRAARRITRAKLASTVAAECLDMHHLPYEDGRYDCVVSFGALHHAREPTRALNEAYRVLKPGGRLCVIDGFDRPAFTAVRRAVRDFGGSFVAAVAYWCGSKDCLSRDRITRVVSDAALPGITVDFDGVLAMIHGTKTGARR